MIREQHPIEPWLRLYTVLIVATTVVALAIAAFQGRTLLYKSFLQFSDLTPYLEKSKHPIGNGDKIVNTDPLMNYPAPGIFVYSLFANLPGDPLAWFLGTVLFAAVTGAVLLERYLARSGVSAGTRIAFVTAVLFTSHPLIYELDRANIEAVIATMVLLGMFFFARGRFTPSVCLIGLAASIKPFPLILLAIFFFHRLYKQVAIGLLVWTVVTVSCFLLLHGDMASAVHTSEAGTSAYRSGIAAGYQAVEMNFDHSAFTLVKQVARLANRWPPTEEIIPLLSRLYLPYLALAALTGLGSLLVLWRKPAVSQILGVFVLMVLLPPSNFDYTLLNLYAPFGFVLAFLMLRLREQAKPLSDGRILALFICFAVIFTSQTYLHLNQTGFGGQVKVLALLGALGIALSWPSTASDAEKRLGGRFGNRIMAGADR